MAGRTFPMQPWITLKGSTQTTTAIVQPGKDWLDGQGYKEAGLNLEILENTPSTTPSVLVLETAIAPEGPWTPLASFGGGTWGAGYTCTSLYFTAREGGTDLYQRFIRWKLDNSFSSSAVWTATFRICATLR